MAAFLPRLLCLLLLTALCPSVRSQELPTKSGTEDMEKEAKKLMEDLPDIVTEAPDVPVAGEDPDASLARAQAVLERVRKKQVRWEKLAKQGVLSRAEAEGCSVEVADALSRQEKARLASLRQQLTAAQERLKNKQADPAFVEAAQAAVDSATTAAAEAEKQARATRLSVARNNLERFRKLLGAGLVSRMQFQRAEANVKKIEADGAAPLVGGNLAAP